MIATPHGRGARDRAKARNAKGANRLALTVAVALAPQKFNGRSSLFIFAFSHLRPTLSSSLREAVCLA